tara:strand:- start:1028 stop:1720 length:693 start_codon:yes stop_codon:yes gene_type:complete
MSSARSAQLALRFPLSARCHFESFVPGRNAELVRRLEELDAEADGFRGYLLFGDAGVGKTHLLQAACHRHGAGGAMYLPLAEVAPAMLEGLETRDLVALDDVDAWLGNVEAERALLALYQGLLTRGGRLLVSAARPAGGLACHFPDLASRLGGLAAYRVHALADGERADVLRRLASERGLALPGPVLDFWLARGPRDLAVLLDQLDALDEAAMAAQRRLTVPLVKDVLGL